MVYLHAKKGIHKQSIYYMHACLLIGANKRTTQDTIPSVHNAAYGRVTGAEIMNVRASDNVAYGLTSQPGHQDETTHVYDAMFDYEYI